MATLLDEAIICAAADDSDSTNVSALAERWLALAALLDLLATVAARTAASSVIGHSLSYS